MAYLETRLERISQIAGYFNELQGLKLVPVAIFLIGIAISRSGIWYWFTIWDPVSTLIFMILCLILYVLISKYYRRQFGQAKALPSKSPSEQTWPTFIFMIAFIAGGYAEYYASVPLGLTSVCIAGWLFYIYYACRPVRKHYIIWSAVVLMLGILPLFGLYEAAAVHIFGPDAIVSMVILGLIILTAGILDHMTLLRLMSKTVDSH